MAHGNERAGEHPDILPGSSQVPLVMFTHMADQMATSYLETNTGNKKPEDVYQGAEPEAVPADPGEFARGRANLRSQL